MSHATELALFCWKDCHMIIKEWQCLANTESNAVKCAHAKQSPYSLATPPCGFLLHNYSGPLRIESFISLSPQLWIVVTSYHRLSTRGRGKEKEVSCFSLRLHVLQLCSLDVTKSLYGRRGKSFSSLVSSYYSSLDF